MIVDQNSELQELTEQESVVKNKGLRIAANILSYLFHPLFVPVFIIWFLLTFEPFFFTGFTPMQKIITLIQFFMIYSFFPLITVLLAKGLGFLQSIHLKTQKDRIIPYIACEIYYFWMAYVIRHQEDFPREIMQLTIAIFLASSIGLLVNIIMKVSMHAISMGVMVLFIGLLGFSQSNSFTAYLSVALLIAGLVCTARMIVSDHSSKEIYTGLLVGAVSMILGVWADGILP
jgi:hypothetical protein